MRITCLGSSSDGNCYILRTDAGTLVVEAGIPFHSVCKALDFDLSRVRGCVVSHSHGDHAAHVRKFLEYGIHVLAPEDVFTRQNIKNRAFCTPAVALRGYGMGGYKIRPFPLVHDVPCFGYIIDSAETRTVFITDTREIRYEIPPHDILMIEANFDDDILCRNIEDGTKPAAMRRRLCASHMEIATLKDILRRADLSRTRQIMLLHTSGSNGDADKFTEEIRAVAGVPVMAARQGSIYEL